MAKNLSGKKWSHKWAVVGCCVLPTCLQQLHYQNYLQQFQESKGHFNQIGVKSKCSTPTKLAQGNSLSSRILAIILLQNTFVARCYTLRHFFLSLKGNWSDSVATLPLLVCLILCWNEKEKQPRPFLHPNLQRVTNHEENAIKKFKHTLAKFCRTGTFIGKTIREFKSIGS